MRTQPLDRSATRIRIFIIGEHAIFGEALRILLIAEQDFAIVGMAANCLAAVDAVRGCAPDVVLIDLGAPVLPEGDALRAIGRAHPPARVIVITPPIGRSVLADALRSGVRGIVRRSAPTQLLAMSIRAVVAGQYWIDREMVTDLVETFCSLPLRARPAIADRRFGLTNRELEIVSLLIAGYANKQIAEKCAIAERTVKHHLANIFEKLDVSSRLEVLLFALHHQIVPINRSGDRSSLSA